MFLIDILANLPFARLARKFGLKMNVFNKNLPSEFTRLVHMVEDSSDLTVFSEKTFPAVIWSRQLSPKTQSWIDKIDPNLLPNARKVLHKSAIKETLEHIFNNASSFIQTDINNSYGHKYLDITKKIEIEEKFDLVLCTNVLEHIFETKLAIKNLNYLLCYF